MYLNTLSARTFFFFLNIENLTLLRRNGSTESQPFVYHFVGNFKLLHEFLFHNFHCVRLQLSEVTTVSCEVPSRHTTSERRCIDVVLTF